MLLPVIIPAVIGTFILFFCCAIAIYIWHQGSPPDDTEKLLPRQRRSGRVLVVRDGDRVLIGRTDITDPERENNVGAIRNSPEKVYTTPVQPTVYSHSPPPYDVATASALSNVDLAGDSGILTGTSYI